MRIIKVNHSELRSKKLFAYLFWEAFNHGPCLGWSGCKMIKNMSTFGSFYDFFLKYLQTTCLLFLAPWRNFSHHHPALEYSCSPEQRGPVLIKGTQPAAKGTEGNRAEITMYHGAGKETAQGALYTFPAHKTQMLSQMWWLSNSCNFSSLQADTGGL